MTLLTKKQVLEKEMQDAKDKMEAFEKEQNEILKIEEFEKKKEILKGLFLETDYFYFFVTDESKITIRTRTSYIFTKLKPLICSTKIKDAINEQIKDNIKRLHEIKECPNIKGNRYNIKQLTEKVREQIQKELDEYIKTIKENKDKIIIGIPKQEKSYYQADNYNITYYLDYTPKHVNDFINFIKGVVKYIKYSTNDDVPKHIKMICNELCIDYISYL